MFLRGNLVVVLNLMLTYCLCLSAFHSLKTSFWLSFSPFCQKKKKKTFPSLLHLCPRATSDEAGDHSYSCHCVLLVLQWMSNGRDFTFVILFIFFRMDDSGSRMIKNLSDITPPGYICWVHPDWLLVKFLLFSIFPVCIDEQGIITPFAQQ